MTFEIGLLLALVVAALALFWWDFWPAEVVGLGLLLTLVFTNLIPAKEAFSGFGSDAVIMILGLLILTSALERTGVVDMTGRMVLKHVGTKPGHLVWVIMIASAGLGAFMSNTASTAFFVPIVLGIAKKSKVSPSRLLMPLAFSSILSSSVTMISTSTNLVISGMIRDYGMESMGMFELSRVGIPITIAGILYMYFIGQRLIPKRDTPDQLTEEFGVRPYLSEVVILPTSALANKTLEEAAVGESLGLQVLSVLREGDKFLAPGRGTVLKPGDILLVRGGREDILRIKDIAGIEIKADVRLSDPDLQAEDTALVEAIVLPGSPILGRTLKSFWFRERTGLQVLGLNHQGKNILEKISQVSIELGDVLLLQGRRTDIERAHEENFFRVLHTIESLGETRPKLKHAPVAIAIFIGVLALTTFKVLTLPVAAMLGVLCIFATRCITPEQAYRRVEWKAIILIGCMLALGKAMETTGTARFLAAQIVGLAYNAEPIWLLSAFFVLTVALTQPMSNQAAAIVVLPIAIQTAVQSGLNPRAFAMMIAIAASCSYLTPLEPSCLMVYGPGRYTFKDFLKVGSLLTLVIGAIAIYLVPKVWSLR